MLSISRGVLHAYTSIAKQEGVVGGLWRGTGANVTRNAIVNVGETVVYDAAKDALLTGGYMRWVQTKLLTLCRGYTENKMRKIDTLTESDAFHSDAKQKVAHVHRSVPP